MDQDFTLFSFVLAHPLFRPDGRKWVENVNLTADLHNAIMTEGGKEAVRVDEAGFPLDILEFRGPHGWLRIVCLMVDKTKTPIAAQGYQHLHYQVGGHGFSGERSGFVAEADLFIFCTRLLELADGHDSEAQLSEQEMWWA